MVDAWFDRADQAMLARATDSELRRQPPVERLHALLMSWLEALAAHRRVTRQMIFGKLEPGHVHVQIPAILRISRTVQWWREAAGRRATYVQRALEESVLTAIYLAAFVHWLGDDSAHSERTRRRLRALLEGAASLGRRLQRSGPPPSRD